MIFVLQYVVGKHNPDFAGTSQQDSHDFLTFLMDGLHEGLNRVSVRVITHPQSRHTVESFKFVKTYFRGL